jgi:hypothetical protein
MIELEILSNSYYFLLLDGAKPDIITFVKKLSLQFQGWVCSRIIFFIVNTTLYIADTKVPKNQNMWITEKFNSFIHSLILSILKETLK